VSGKQFLGPPGEQKQDAGDDQIDERTGDRDGDFVPRILGHRPQRRDAADGQQCDAFDLNAELLRHDAVPQFVQDDAGKQRADQRQRPPRPRHPAAGITLVGKEGQQQQKRHM